MKYLGHLQPQNYSFDLFTQVILLEQSKLIVVDQIEADDGKLEQGNEVFYHFGHPFELLLLFHIQVLRFLLSLRELDLTPCVVAVSHHGAS